MLLGEKYSSQKSSESGKSLSYGSPEINNNKFFSQIPADMLDSTYINIQKLKDEKAKMLSNDLTASITESGQISLFNNLLDSNYAYADNTFERTNSMSFFATKLSDISSNKKSTQNNVICESNEYFHADPSVIENVDLIEINTDSSGSDQEFSWLCNPMKDMNNESLVNYLTSNTSNKEASDSVDVDTGSIDRMIAPRANKSLDWERSEKRRKPTNPYKWIKEDFEDRNLDKVKRALLVTLDDISKGKNRRSRSVSVTRTPLIQNLQETPQRVAASPRKTQQYQRAITQQILITPGSGSTPSNDQPDFDNQNNLSHRDENKENHLNISISKSMENAEDSNPSELTETIKNQPKVNYSTATIVKRKNTNRIEISTESSDHSKSSHSYEDFTDVQAIAKMQEESLRQDILNSNKASNRPQTDTNKGKTPYYHEPPPPPPPQSIYRQADTLQADATYKSNLNIKLAADKKKKTLPHSSTTSLTEAFLESKSRRLNEAQPANRMFNIDPRYRTITKSSTMSNNMSIMESLAKSNTFIKKSQSQMRSITPSTSFQQQQQQQVKNTTVNSNDSRLPTPRSSRITMDAQNEQLNGVHRPPQVPTAPTAPIQSPSRRTLLPYGAQRSATTSIVPNRPGGKSIYSTSPSPTPRPNVEASPVSNQTTSWQKKKSTKAQMSQQAEEMLYQQQQHQQQLLYQQQQQKFLQAQTHKSSFGSHNNLYASSNLAKSSRPANRAPSPSTNIVNSSPSGLFTNGPIGRKPKINSSNNYIDSYEDTASSNMTPRATSQSKKSFLPQPVQYNQQAYRQTSPSPIRHDFHSQPYSWKDGCY